MSGFSSRRRLRKLGQGHSAAWARTAIHGKWMCPDTQRCLSDEARRNANLEGGSSKLLDLELLHVGATAPRQPGRLRVLVVADQRHTRAGTSWEKGSGTFCAALRAEPGVEAFMLTNTPSDNSAPLGTVIHQPWDDPSVFALDASQCDPVGHHGHHPGLPRAFEALLRGLRPDIVDFHGFPWFGIDAFAQVRRALPASRVVLTLDHKAALQAGMLVRAPSAWTGRPQKQPPATSAPDAFLRDMFLRRFLEEVDCLIARGPMMADALIGWGAPCKRIEIILPNHAEPSQSVLPPPKARGFIVGCFADSLDEEGVEVLLEADAALRGRPPSARPIRIELHGCPAPIRSTAQSREFPAVSPLIYCKPLDGRDVSATISGWHAILIPGHSLSDIPGCALTGLALGRPVLCGNTGGTAAVVRDGHDGYHFRSCSGVSLADLIDDLAAAPERLAALQPGCSGPQFRRSSLEATLELYRSLTAPA